MREGRMGVTYFDHYYVVLQKGAPTAGNADVYQFLISLKYTFN